MREDGFIVHCVYDGENGLEKADQEKPDIILLDIVLPGIDGYEVLRRPKTDKDLAKIPVLILSNLGQVDEIKRGKDLGAVDFLIKAHFDLNEIVGKIKEILAKIGHN